MTLRTVRVYTCSAESNEGEASTLIPGRESGNCATGAGAWVTVTYSDEGVPVMDVVSVLIALGLVLAWTLGFAAGKQR